MGGLMCRFLNGTFNLVLGQVRVGTKMAGGDGFLLSRLPLPPPSCPALQSSILFSLAQSCSVVHECQLSAASTLYLSLPLTLPQSLGLSLPPSLLISLP